MNEYPTVPKYGGDPELSGIAAFRETGLQQKMNEQIKGHDLRMIFVQFERVDGMEHPVWVQFREA